MHGTGIEDMRKVEGCANTFRCGNEFFLWSRGGCSNTGGLRTKQIRKAYGHVEDDVGTKNSVCS
jgi:hypothetical protein